MQRVLESLCKRFALAMVVFSALAAEGWAQCAPAQTISGIPPVPNWQIAAGGKMSFDVASVKPSKPGSDTTSNFPLGPGEIYAAVGGRFCATGTTALNYVAFAYKLAGRDRQSIGASLPGWVSTDGFDIEAKGAVNATKDQMRLMMQSVLADRFKVAIHQETRQAPALRMLVVQPGKLGPQLQIHADEGACVSTASNAGRATPPSPPVATIRSATANDFLRWDHSAASECTRVCGSVREIYHSQFWLPHLRILRWELTDQ